MVLGKMEATVVAVPEPLVVVVAALVVTALDLFALLKPVQSELLVRVPGMMIPTQVLALVMIVLANTTAPVSVLLNTP